MTQEVQDTQKGKMITVTPDKIFKENIGLNDQTKMLSEHIKRLN